MRKEEPASLLRELARRCNVEVFTLMTSAILESYRSGRFAVLRRLAGALGGVMKDPEGEPSRVFAHLMLLYHPDRTKRWEAEISRAREAGDGATLSGILQIFTAFDEVFGSHGGRTQTSRRREWKPSSPEWPEEEVHAYGSEDFDDTVDADGGWPTGDFSSESSYAETPDGDFEEPEEEAIRRTLFEALYAREYGHVETDLQPRHLESFQGELDLSDYEITDLDGAAHLIHIRILQLSENRIETLAPLASLRSLEELYLASNRIYELDGLEGLVSLRLLDLQNNRFTDIGPILGLPLLEFVNLLGNPVPFAQVEALRRRGVVVLSAEGTAPGRIP